MTGFYYTEGERLLRRTNWNFKYNFGFVSLQWVKRSAKNSRNSSISQLMTCGAAPVSSCLVHRHISIQYMFRRSLSETFMDIAPNFTSHRFIMRQLTANRKPSYHSHFMYLGNLLLNGALSVVWQRRIGKPTFKMSLLLIQSWRKLRTFQNIFNIPGVMHNSQF